jgi:hypothetical protein
MLAMYPNPAVFNYRARPVIVGNAKFYLVDDVFGQFGMLVSIGLQRKQLILCEEQAGSEQARFE